MHLQRLALSCVFLLCAACGGGAPAGADKPAQKPAAREPEALKDRSQTALTPTKETIDAVAFTIDLPAGFKREANAKEQWINWTVTDGNPFKEPSITIKLSDAVMVPGDLGALARSATSASQDKPPLVVSRQEELPGGGMIVVAERSDALYFKVDAVHRRDDKVLRCSFLQRTGIGKPDDTPIPNFAATKAWAEKICGSVKFE